MKSFDFFLVVIESTKEILVDDRRERAIVEYLNTEESSFVGNQCSWLSWITLAEEFSFPQAFVLNLLKLSQLSTNKITFPRSGKNWLPTNIDPHE